MRQSFQALLLTLLLGFVFQFAYGQQFSVKGTVTDPDGHPMPGVNVILKGTTTGTVTNLDGQYSITTADENAVMVFNFVGFKTREMAIGGRTLLDVVLEEEMLGLDEVVVVGYGTQRKANLTGSVASVNFSDQAESRPITNVSSALAGLASGVTVRQGVGNPGSDGASIRIRGLGTLNNNNPLIIIDGMEGVLDAINPNDIESISVLKDAASAAIYGSRAANGVVLVTTKRGNREKSSVTYSGRVSISSPSNLLEFVSDYPTYMGLINEGARNIGQTEHFNQSTIDAWQAANQNPNGLNENGVPNWLAFPNTNWSKEMYETNLVQEHNVSVSGGSEKSTFLLSAGFLDNPGLVENTGLKRYSIRTNLETNITKWLTVGTRTYVTQQDKELGNYASMLNFARQSTPGLVGEYNGQYGYPEASEESATANNLYGFLNNRDGDDRSSRFNTTLYSIVEVLPGLSWNFNLNYGRRIDEYNSFTNGAAGERIRFSDGTVMAQKTDPSQMSTYYSTWANESLTLENLLRYETTFGADHDFAALLGYNENNYFSYDHNATKKGLIDQTVTTLGSATEMISINGGASDYSMRSWFGRVNYGYMQRYLLEANFRYDGSSRFHSDYRWGMFPSLSAAWRISEESILGDLDWLQNLKVRASWGQLGNNASGNYDYQSVYGVVGYSFAGNQAPGLRPTRISNMLLEWETTTMTNLGLDFNVLGDRLTGEIDYYKKVTDGILTTPPIPITSGLVGAPRRNTAEVTNTGMEFTLGWRDRVGDFRYSVSGNFALNNNEVSKYKGKFESGWRINEEGEEYYFSNLGDVSDGGMTRVLEGHMINEYYLLNVYQGSGNYYLGDGALDINGGPNDGMIRTPEDLAWVEAMIAEGYRFLPNQQVRPGGIYYGDLIYADNNEDGVYGNDFDRNFTGSSSMPKYTFGANINLNWKNFDLSMVWSGNGGYKLWWNEFGYNNSNLKVGNQVGAMLVGNQYYYNPDDPSDPSNNINAEYPRLKLDENDPQNRQTSTFWLYDASYLKLRNLTVGYTLPENMTNRMSMQRVRVYVSGENLLTITSFPGLDPEMGANVNYPIMRQIAFGANITF